MSDYRDLGGSIGRLTPHQVQTLKEAGKGPVLARLYTHGPLGVLRRKGLVEMKSAQEAFPKTSTKENKEKYGVITDKGNLALEAIAQLDALESAAATSEPSAAANEEQPTEQMSLWIT